MTNGLTWLALVLGIDLETHGASARLPQFAAPDTGGEPSPAGPPK